MTKYIFSFFGFVFFIEISDHQIEHKIYNKEDQGGAKIKHISLSDAFAKEAAMMVKLADTYVASDAVGSILFENVVTFYAVSP